MTTPIFIKSKRTYVGTLAGFPLYLDPDIPIDQLRMECEEGSRTQFILANSINVDFPDKEADGVVFCGKCGKKL